MNINLEQAIRDTKAHCVYQKDAHLVRLNGAASDNRLVKDGDIFVCIKGNTVDGHDFAQNAMERGAKAILAEYNPFEKEYGDNPPIPVLIVENSVKALGKLAHARRMEYKEDASHKVIAITGTAGKTSVKELIAHILSLEWTENEDISVNPNRVAKNPLNNNTQIGMPIAILNARGDEQFWILELGISHAHDMDELGAILEPDLALILNVGSGHTEGLGEKGVAYHKAQLLKYVQKNGMAFVSMDYPELVREAKAYPNTNTRYFSVLDKNIQSNPCHDNSNIGKNTSPYGTATYLGINEHSLGTYSLHVEKTDITTSSPLLGKSGAENCLAASCITHVLGIQKEIIIHGCETVPMPNRRFNRTICKNWDIIDDCYNSNPLSSTRMIESAKELAENKNFYVLMGEMKELGKATYEEHVNLAKKLASANVDVLFWVGEQKDAVQEGLRAESFSGLFIPLSAPDAFITELSALENVKIQENRVNTMPNKEAERENSKNTKIENLILFKGSRSNHLENYVHCFKEFYHVI